ncbi:MAG TPA: hypothetical protein VGO62_00140 [Myxococcota bacterium]
MSENAAPLPMPLWALVATASDDARPREARVRALAILERTARDHGHDVAIALAPLLNGAPDLAARVHLALLVLAPDLAVGRTGDDGAFTASTTPLSLCDDDGVGKSSSDVGRVVGLDALARLFGPADEAPLFLAPPAQAAPPAYRPVVTDAARAVLQAQADDAAARALHSEKLRALGLDDDDLDDDRGPTRASFVPRFQSPLLGTVSDGEAIAIACAGAVVDVGQAHAGVWWADERAGDHRGARRFHVRLERAGPSGKAVVRRERPLPMRDATVEVALGEVRLHKRITGRGVVAFVEEEDDLVVGVMLSWSAWEPFRPNKDAASPAKVKPRL